LWHQFDSDVRFPNDIKCEHDDDDDADVDDNDDNACIEELDDTSDVSNYALKFPLRFTRLHTFVCNYARLRHNDIDAIAAACGASLRVLSIAITSLSSAAFEALANLAATAPMLVRRVVM
jgi:hypothetical protein